MKNRAWIGDMNSTGGRNWRKRGLFRILEVSCTVFCVVFDSSQESLVGEPVSKNNTLWNCLWLSCYY